jgi:hypothetical protein
MHIGNDNFYIEETDIPTYTVFLAAEPLSVTRLEVYH